MRVAGALVTAAEHALQAPAQDEGAEWSPEALEVMYAATGGYPYFIQAYGKVTWDAAPASPITAHDVEVAGPEAEEVEQRRHHEERPVEAIEHTIEHLAEDDWMAHHPDQEAS